MKPKRQELLSELLQRYSKAFIERETNRNKFERLFSSFMFCIDLILKLVRTVVKVT